METRQSKETREVGRAIITAATGGRLSKTDTYSMAVRDFVIVGDTSGGAFTVTLPPVAEARGKIYTVKTSAVHAAGGAGLNLTITDHAATNMVSDSRHWLGDIILSGIGQSAVLFSDGEEWHRLYVSPGAGLQKIKHIFEDFSNGGVLSGGTKNGGAAPTATGDEIFLMMHSGNMFEIHYIGAGQTLLGPVFGEPGINVAHDLAATEGVEYSMGLYADSPGQFVIGTDPAFYARIRLLLTDVDGTADCLFGFRKTSAYQGAVDDYLDMSAFNIISGDVYVETILNNATTDSDDTVDNWGDGETHNLEVRVSAAGVVTNFFDDAAPSTTPTSFTFDDGDTVMSFFHLLHDTNVAETTVIYEWEVGYQ